MDGDLWTAWVVFLYGSLLIVGGFLSMFWSTMAWRRVHAIEHRWYEDRYYLLALGIGVTTGGYVLSNIGRLSGSLLYGLWPTMRRPEAYLITAGLVTVLIGSMLIVLLADLEKHPPKWLFLKLTTGALILWAAFSLAIATHIPLAPDFRWGF